MKTSHTPGDPLLPQTDASWHNNMSNARVLSVICSCGLLALLLVAILLDIFLSWRENATKSSTTYGLFIATASFNMVFFTGNFFQLVFAIKDYEHWRSHVIVPVLTAAALALASAIIRFCINSYETGGLLLAVTFAQIGYYRGISWREKLHLQQAQRSNSVAYV